MSNHSSSSFRTWKERRKYLFNDALNTFYLLLYGVRHMVKDHSDSGKETRRRHIGYSFRLTARVLLYAPSHRQDSTYHGLCYTSRGALAGTIEQQSSPNMLCYIMHLSSHASFLRPHSEQAVIAHACHGHTLQLSTGLSV